MFTRVVRFTDVDADRLDRLLAEAGEGPAPEGTNMRSLQILHDRSAATAVVLQHFDSAQDMEEGGKVFAAMDSADTPGTRASVDACEVRLERQPA